MNVIPGFPGYWITEYGQVWSDKQSGRWLKPSVTGGRPKVSLSRGGKMHSRPVHILVLEAFIGPRPVGLVGRHLNGNPLDNRPGNLKWGTYSENNTDTVIHGTHMGAAKTHCVHDHEFTEENTYMQRRSDGRIGRTCRLCHRNRQRLRSTRG